MSLRSEYRRLPGRTLLTLSGGYQLWAGRDHLLCVRNSRFWEEYGRFAYRDVEAVVVQKTRRGVYLAVGLAAAACLSLLLGLASGRSSAFSWAPAAVFLALLGLNAILGRTCRCFLYTAVHREELRCLRRLRTAERCLGRLLPLLEAAQGPSPEAKSVPAAVEVGPVPEARGPDPARAPPLPPRPAQAEASGPHRVWLHRLAFATLLAHAGTGALLLAYPNLGSGVVDFFTGMAAVALMVGAVARQAEARVPDLVRRLGWAGIAYAVVYYLAGSVGVTIFQVREAASTQTQANHVWSALAQYDLFQSTPLRFFRAGMSAAAAAVGGLGLFALRGLRSSPAPSGPPPLPATPRPEADE